MSDTALTKFIQYGTNAQRLAFTPSPAAGTQPLYTWYETDTGLEYQYTTTWIGPFTSGGAVPIDVTASQVVQTNTGWVVPESLEIASGVSLEIAGGARVEVTGAAGIHGIELDYVEFTSSVTISATTDATATTIVTGNAVTYDGTTPVRVEFFCPSSNPAGSATAEILYDLYLDGASVGRIGLHQNPAANANRVPVFMTRRVIPTSGSHTYSMRAHRTVGDGTAEAGVGGTGNLLPGYLRIVTV